MFFKKKFSDSTNELSYIEPRSGESKKLVSYDLVNGLKYKNSNQVALCQRYFLF